MTDRNGIIDQIEELLGSEGSRELAEAMLPILQKDGYVTFDAQNGFTLSPLPDDGSMFTSTVAEAEESLRPTAADQRAHDLIVKHRATLNRWAGDAQK